MSEVFFVNVRAKYKQSLLDKFEKLSSFVKLKDIISQGDLVAIKLHFGEYGNLAHIRPQYVKKIVDIVREKQGKPFLTDTNTLYAGERKNAQEHITTAILNGFSYSTTSAPVIIADGLLGLDYVDVEINLKHFKSAKIASGIFHSNAIVCLSHFKLHEASGFGGAIKNLGMGCAAIPGKQNMHCEVAPKIIKNKCTGCGNCAEWCRKRAIKINGKIAEINQDLCWGCGECVAVCRFGAVEINWKTNNAAFQEKVVEYAFASVKNKIGKSIFFNFLLDISPDCDCCAWNDAPVVPDIGILASYDPVAIDCASVDLFNKAKGLENTKLKDLTSKDKIFDIHKIDWTIQLDYAEKIGLGSKKYKFVEL